jgi:hypothetical protein
LESLSARGEYRDLFLGGEEKIHGSGFSDCLGGVQPPKRIEPETRHRMDFADVAGKPGQTNLRGGKYLDMMSKSAQSGRHLP